MVAENLDDAQVGGVSAAVDFVSHSGYTLATIREGGA